MVGLETRYCKGCGVKYEHCDLDDNDYDLYCPIHQVEKRKLANEIEDGVGSF